MDPALSMHRVRVARVACALAIGLATLGPVLAQPGAQPADPVLVVEAGAHVAPVRRIAVDARGGRLVTTSDDRTARVWDLASGRLLRTLRPPIGPEPVGRLYGAAVHPRRAVVAVGGAADVPGGASSPIFLFDLDSGRLVSRIDTGATEVRRLQWSADGTLLAACFAGSDGLRVYDEAGREVFRDAYPAPCFGLDASAQGLLAASVSRAELRLYRAQGGAVVPLRTVATELPDPRGIAFSPDGGRLAVGFLSTAPGGRARVRVHASDTGAQLAALDAARTADTSAFNLWAVAWSADGRTVYGAGRYHHGEPRYAVVAFDGADGRRVGEVVVARDSVLDLAAAPDGRVVWAAFDGSWGLADATRVQPGSTPGIADFRGAGELRVAADGGRIRFTRGLGADPAVFDFGRRTVVPGDDPAARPAAGPRGVFAGTTRVENRLDPVVRGVPVAVPPNEPARALACLPQGEDCALATTRTLRLLDARARDRWSVAMPTEPRSVAVVRGGGALVTAHADGVLRFWRSADGGALLSLYPAADGRWIAWTPAGHYDASEGAEGLAGWAVPRGPATESDFVSLGRFRDRYHRPDVVDLTLRLLDAPAAFREAERLRRERGDVEPGEPPAPAAPVPVLVATVPPVLVAEGATAVETSAERVSLPFALRVADGAGPIAWQVRVDGVRVDDARVEPPTAGPGRVDVAVSVGASVVELIAQDGNGPSEPLRFDVRRSGPAAAAPPAGRLLVVSVGISRYRRPDYALGLAAKDARDFVDTMRTRGAGVFADVQARLLLDEAATARAIVDALGWVADDARPGDTVAVFLAGHGVTDAGGRYWFMPHEGEFEKLRGTAVSGPRIRALLARIRARTLLFLDTCYAGGLLAPDGAQRARATSLANAAAAPEVGAVVFSSSSGTQESLERAEWGNGAFTKALLDGLRGEADADRSGRVTHRELDPFVQAVVRRLTASVQTPVIVVPASVPDFEVAAGGGRAGD